LYQLIDIGPQIALMIQLSVKNQTKSAYPEKSLCACVAGVNQQFLAARFISNTSELKKIQNLIPTAGSLSAGCLLTW